MKQTLTTEAMQEIYEAAVHSEASGSQEAEFELLCKLEDVGGTSATIRKLIDKVRAANREPQPVAVPEFLTYLREPIISNVLADDDNSPMANAARILACEVKFWRSQPLFTAPPAPVVPDAVDTFADQVIGTKTKIIRMPAPSNVPQEGIRVYLNADKLIKIVESQGYQVIIEV